MKSFVRIVTILLSTLGYSQILIETINLPT